MATFDFCASISDLFWPLQERTEKLENDVTVAESGARNVDALQDKLATAQTERDKALMRAERLNSEVKKLTDEVNVLKKVCPFNL